MVMMRHAYEILTGEVCMEESASEIHVRGYVRVWTSFIWRRIGSSGGLLCETDMPYLTTLAVAKIL
jgi:hypothetical protein